MTTHGFRPRFLPGDICGTHVRFAVRTAPRILRFLRGGDFRECFLGGGHFRDYLEYVPTRIVTRDDAGLLGALQFLKRSHGS